MAEVTTHRSSGVVGLERHPYNINSKIFDTTSMSSFLGSAAAAVECDRTVNMLRSLSVRKASLTRKLSDQAQRLAKAGSSFIKSIDAGDYEEVVPSPSSTTVKQQPKDTPTGSIVGLSCNSTRRHSKLSISKSVGSAANDAVVHIRLQKCQSSSSSSDDDADSEDMELRRVQDYESSNQLLITGTESAPVSPSPGFSSGLRPQSLAFAQRTLSLRKETSEIVKSLSVKSTQLKKEVSQTFLRFADSNGGEAESTVAQNRSGSDCAAGGLRGEATAKFLQVSNSGAQLVRSLSAKGEQLSAKLQESKSPEVVARRLATEVATRVKTVSKEVREMAHVVMNLDSSPAPKDESEYDDEDSATKEKRERIEIVSKYDKGREGQEIDAWEDPNFELFEITDRYGFIDSKNSRDLVEAYAKAKTLEVKRLPKWLKMYQDWPRFDCTLKLRRRIYKGIPDKFRGQIWGRLLGVESARMTGVYEQLKLRALLISPEIRQIDLDINRTYRNHECYRRRYDIKQRSLFHVLVAYSMYNEEVGYCQGMSQLAALLLMYFEEDEDAFWALHILMTDERYGMHGLFVPGFPKLVRLQQHHDKLLKKLLPALKKHLDKLDIQAALYTTKWYFQCFLDRVPFSLALRLWDVYLLDGERILIAMAYNILKMHKRTLGKMNFEQTMDFLQQKLEHDFGYSDDEVIDSLRNCIDELRRSKLLHPDPAPNSEKPNRRFGTVLVKPLDEVAQSASVPELRKKRVKLVQPKESVPNGSVTVVTPEDIRSPPSPAPKPVPVAAGSPSKMSPLRPSPEGRQYSNAAVPNSYSASTIVSSRSGLSSSSAGYDSRGVYGTTSPTTPSASMAESHELIRPPQHTTTTVAGGYGHSLRPTASFYDNVSSSMPSSASQAASAAVNDRFTVIDERFEQHNTFTPYGGQKYTSEYSVTHQNVSSTSSVSSTPVKERQHQPQFGDRQQFSIRYDGGTTGDSKVKINRKSDNVTVVEIRSDGLPDVETPGRSYSSGAYADNDDTDYDYPNPSHNAIEYNDGPLPRYYFGNTADRRAMQFNHAMPSSLLSMDERPYQSGGGGDQYSRDGGYRSQQHNGGGRTISIGSCHGSSPREYRRPLDANQCYPMKTSELQQHHAGPEPSPPASVVFAERRNYYRTIVDSPTSFDNQHNQHRTAFVPNDTDPRLQHSATRPGRFPLQLDDAVTDAHRAHSSSMVPNYAYSASTASNQTRQQMSPSASNKQTVV